MTDTCKLVVIACVVGFVGDFLLQIMTGHLGMGGESGWGLKEYFRQHGAAESLFIAAGMMTVFFILYIFVLNLPITYQYLAIFGIILDLIFRKTMLFSSLKGYYFSLNYFWSAFWGAIPLMAPLFFYNILQ